MDLSWWPKVNIWDGSGLDLGRWTPFCEGWFKNRFQSLREGQAKPLTSAQWHKNLRYEQKDTKKFFGKWKDLGERFLIEGCNVRDL